jgi:hypothetical protein
MRLEAQHEVVSPELVLVDPALADRARAQLPEPPDALRARPARDPVVAPAPGVLAAPTAPPPASAARRRAAIIAGSAAVLAVALLLADVRVELGRTPAIAESTIQEEPVATTPPAQPSRSPAPPMSGVRRFAWVPVRGADGYRVEIFRGQSLVFRADVDRPEIGVPASWTFRGQRTRLSPGEYRWYVWPVVSGRRASSAVVQARLVIPSAS